MIYLIYSIYSPDNAPINRFLAFVKGFQELEIPHQVIFIEPNRDFAKADEEYGSQIEYLWKGRKLKNRWLNLAQYALWSRILCRHSFRKFLNTLTPADTVVLFNGMQHLHRFLGKGVKIYHERTEHPYAYEFFKSDRETARYIDCCKRVTGLFVISESLKRSFVELGVAEDRIHVINMIVDTNRFQNVRKNADVEKYIAYCGTASNNKDGVDDLIRSFALTARDIEGIKLYIIGKTPSLSDEAQNLQLVESLGLRDRIVFMGKVPAERMPQLLKDARVLVLARPDSLQAQNGFPTKLGEYLLTENPVVITRTGDIPLFLEDGVSALLAEPRNCAQIAAKISWALKHPEESARIGKAGAKVALRDFNYRVESQKIHAVITAE